MSVTTALARPTQAPQEERENLSWWRARPLAAFAVRTLVFLVPIATSIATTSTLARAWSRPGGTWPGVGWWLVLVAAGGLAMWATERVARRFLPLSMLLRMSLVFPDEKPSRFGVALRTGTTRQLRQRVDDIAERGLTGNERSAAEQLLELVAALRVHDRFTRGHGERVRAYAALIGEELGLDEIDRSKLQWAGLIHDVGKLAVPDEILNKPGRLTDEEFDVIKTHPAEGMRLAGPLAPWLGEWILAVGEHHERWDGTGYPNRLAGTEISLAGRIVAVADVFDVITAARSYKKPQAPHAAREELARHAGSQFDPDIVRAFLAISIGRLRTVMWPLSWLANVPYLGTSVTAPATSWIAPAVVAVGTAVTGSAVAASDVPADPPAIEFPAGADAPPADPPPGADVAFAPPLATGEPENTASPSAASTTAASTDVPTTTVADSPGDPDGADGGDVDRVATGTPLPLLPEPVPAGIADTTATTAAPAATPSPTPPAPEPVEGTPATAPPSGTTTTVAAPAVTLPAVTIPPATVPGVTVPTAPATTTPAITTPPTTLPVVTVPPTVPTPPTTAPPATTTPPTPCELLELGETELSGLDLSGCSLVGVDLTGVDLTGADLTGADLTGAVFDGVDLEGADLEGADLTGAVFTGVDLEGADLEGADLTGAVFRDSTFDDVVGTALVADGARFERVGFDGADLTGADLSSVRLVDVSFDGADLSGADLTDAVAGGVDFDDARLDGADLSRAVLDHAELSFASAVGTRFVSASLRRAQLDGADLTSASVRYAVLRDAVLDGTDLNGADLRGADLSGATDWPLSIVGTLFSIGTTCPNGLPALLPCW